MNGKLVSKIVGLVRSRDVIVTLEPPDPKQATNPAVPAIDGMSVSLLGSSAASIGSSAKSCRHLSSWMSAMTVQRDAHGMVEFRSGVL